MTTNPARWHPDPTGRHELRYWDGFAWTEHVSDRGVAARDPVGSPGQHSVAEAQLMPSSEGRSTPANHEPLDAGPSGRPRRTRPTAVTRPMGRSAGRPGPRQRPRPRRSTAPRIDSPTVRSTPIVTEAGWSRRTKLLVAFIALDAIVAAVLIWLVG